MNKIALRSTTLAAVLLGAIGIMLTGCGGGGGGSSSPAPQVLASASGSLPTMPNQTVNNFTGPTSTISISLTIPKKVQASAAQRAKFAKLYGPRQADKHIRTIANTSPSAAIRAAGLQLNRSALAFQQKTGRSPTYISGSTSEVEFVLNNGNSNVVDQSVSCSVGSCNFNVTAPVGSNYTAALFLYDNCGFLLSAGSTGGVTVTAGVTTPVNITMNGIVSYIDVEQAGATTPLQEDPSLAQNMTVSVTPEDVDQNPITTPGVLMDSSFTQITQINLSTVGTDPNSNTITPTDLCVNACPGTGTTTVTVNPDLTVPTTAYAFSGTGFAQSEEIVASGVTSGPQLVPQIFDFGQTSGEDLGELYLPTTPDLMSWTLNGGMSNFGQFTATASSPNFTNNNLEYSIPNTTDQVTFTLNENIAGLASNVTISDNGQCGPPVGSYSPGLGMYALSTINTTPFFTVRLNSTGPTATCVVTAVDDATNPNTAQMSIFTDSSNVTVQSKIRARSQTQVRTLK